MSGKCYECGQENNPNGTICSACKARHSDDLSPHVPSSSWQDGLRAGLSAGACIGAATAFVYGILGSGLTALLVGLVSSNSKHDPSSPATGYALGMGLTLTVMLWTFLKSLLEMSVLGTICGALGKLSDRTETMKYGTLVGALWTAAMTHSVDFSRLLEGAFWGFAGAALCYSFDKSRRGY